jgi:hypothetical protein
MHPIRWQTVNWRHKIVYFLVCICIATINGYILYKMSQTEKTGIFVKKNNKRINLNTILKNKNKNVFKKNNLSSSG